jgi:hypothetical protein
MMQASPPKSGASQGLAAKRKKRGRPKTGVKTPWKELGLSKATYYRRIRSL